MTPTNSAAHHQAAPPRKASLLIAGVLFFLASIHCATSIFWVNYSYLDLQKYSAGTGPLPYQARIGMIPVLRLAEHSPRFVALAAKIDANRKSKFKRYTYETISPEKLASILVGIISLLATVTVAAFYGLKRFPAMWWLPPALLLAMLYATQAARYEVTLWYPYDLPHMFLFGSACLLVLEGAWVPALLLFLIDLPVRETAIFLAAVTITVARARNQRRQGLILAAIMLAVWIPFRLFILHRFAANPATEMGVHLENFKNALNPTHWPQMMSAFGFLLIPLCLWNRLLSPSQRAFLFGAIPCLILTLAFGVWSETRIFSEWLLPAAVLLTAELSHRFTPNPQLSTNHYPLRTTH